MVTEADEQDFWTGFCASETEPSDRKSDGMVIGGPWSTSTSPEFPEEESHNIPKNW